MPDPVSTTERDADAAWEALTAVLLTETSAAAAFRGGVTDVAAVVRRHRPVIEAALRAQGDRATPRCTFPGCTCGGTLPRIPTDPIEGDSATSALLRAGLNRILRESGNEADEIPGKWFANVSGDYILDDIAALLADVPDPETETKP